MQHWHTVCIESSDMLTTNFHFKCPHSYNIHMFPSQVCMNKASVLSAACGTYLDGKRQQLPSEFPSLLSQFTLDQNSNSKNSNTFQLNCNNCTRSGKFITNVVQENRISHHFTYFLRNGQFWVCQYIGWSKECKFKNVKAPVHDFESSERGTVGAILH